MNRQQQTFDSKGTFTLSRGRQHFWAGRFLNETSKEHSCMYGRKENLSESGLGYLLHTSSCLVRKKNFRAPFVCVIVKENSHCRQSPLSERYCYLTSGTSSLKEAVTYCRNHGGWLMAEPSGDVLANLPENYTWKQMWLAGTRLKWIWNNNNEIKDSHWLAGKDYPFQDMCLTLVKVGQPNDEAEVRWISVSCDQMKPFICQIRMTGNNANVGLYAGIGGGLIILIIIIVIILVFLRRCFNNGKSAKVIRQQPDDSNSSKREEPVAYYNNVSYTGRDTSNSGYILANVPQWAQELENREVEINSSLKVHENDIYPKPNENESRDAKTDYNIIDNGYSVPVLGNKESRDQSSTVMKEKEVIENVNTEKKSKEELKDMTPSSVAQYEEVIMIDNVLYSSNSTLNE